MFASSLGTRIIRNSNSGIFTGSQIPVQWVQCVVIGRGRGNGKATENVERMFFIWSCGSWFEMKGERVCVVGNSIAGILTGIQISVQWREL